ncbi:leucine-rich repeat receptor-like serine/threonine-protein kinase BAM3 [Malus domestica]|uniref:leucine-rich repeat receptor-like serine/threonine-protein kinase BAM3 n=1 Tax=Malus domestica TaxID=3750 RepID=UPI00397591A9
MIFHYILLLLSALPLIKTTSISPGKQAESLIKWNDHLSPSWPPSPLNSWSLTNLNSLCNWTAIVCTKTRTVSEIDLSGMNMYRTLAHFDFSLFPNLTHFNLSGNHFLGPIPSAIGNLSRLTTLDLSGNFFLDDTPYSKGNQFSGPIPDSIGLISGLQHIDLSWNRLEGKIPPSIGQLRELQYLDLSANSFISSKLENNSFSGTISVEIGLLIQLQYLSFYSNKFSGEIPQSLGNLSQFQVLYLFDNHLTGEIPQSIGKLTQLQVLKLSHNHLTGEIPQSLGKLTQLQSGRMSISLTHFVLPLSRSLRPPLSLTSSPHCSATPSFPNNTDPRTSTSPPPLPATQLLLSAEFSELELQNANFSNWVSLGIAENYRTGDVL